MLRRDGLSKAEFRRQVQALLARAAGYAWTIVRNREDAEDALQEAALKAWRSLSSYDCSRPFKGWWFSIVRNCCLDLLRRRRSRPGTSLGLGCDIPAEDASDPAGHEDLYQAMARLAVQHREVLELRYFADCSYREIAAVLEIPEGTVMSRLHAARLMLADIIRKENP